jgi:hypothetical protein
MKITQKERERSLIIENQNSSSQGHCPYHAENPHHNTLIEFGWKYSHTTPIKTVDGSHYALHTYRYPGTDSVVSINCRDGWRADASRLGINRNYPYFGSQLRCYLKRKTRQIEKLTG